MWDMSRPLCLLDYTYQGTLANASGAKDDQLVFAHYKVKSATEGEAAGGGVRNEQQSRGNEDVEGRVLGVKKTVRRGS